MKNLMGMLVVLASVSGIATAGPRSSARYQVPTEANDAGGGASGSAAYANTGNIGGFAGVSSAGTHVAKHGFAGQLYDVMSLVVAANPPSVNEGEATQLSVTATLDDGTWIGGASQVQWSVVSGPVASITPSGLATMDVVYQNETAAVQGALLGSVGSVEIAVANSDLDNYGKFGGDQIDDAWQVQHFGFDHTLAGPENDPDGDGQNNYFEYFATSNPMDPLSLFRLRIQTVEGRPTHRKIIFSPRSPAREYQVEYKLDLAAGAFAPLAGGTVSDNGDERTVTDENATEDHRFYRVGISIP